MSSSSDAVIIVNPVSGRGIAKGRSQTIERLARGLGWSGELLETTVSLHAGFLAEKAVQAGSKHIIVCGGDGSVMEALAAVAGTETALGVVPLGTGNLFAVNLDLPRTINNALKVALFGTPQAIDIGKANGHYFGILTGIGWDAAMVRDAKRELKDRLGLLAYFLAAIRNFEHPISRFSMSIDQAEPIIFSAKSIVVANMGLIPGRIEAIPKARPDSGELAIAIVQAESLFSWVALSASALTGRLVDDPRLQLFAGKEIMITSLDGPQLIEADGNDLPPAEKLAVEVVPGGAIIYLPLKHGLTTPAAVH